MAQISKANPEGLIQKELFSQFYWVISELRNSQETENLFSELLTKTERVMLAKRLAIALLLIKGYSYREIRFVLHVSFPTIRSIQFWLDYGSKGYQKAIEKITARESLNSLLETIDKLLDKR